MATRKTPPRRGVWAAADSTPIAGAAAVTARAPPAFKSSRRVSEVMHASLPDDGTRILGAQVADVKGPDSSARPRADPGRNRPPPWRRKSDEEDAVPAVDRHCLFGARDRRRPGRRYERQWLERRRGFQQSARQLRDLGWQRRGLQPRFDVEAGPRRGGGAAAGARPGAARGRGAPATPA